MKPKKKPAARPVKKKPEASAVETAMFRLTARVEELEVAGAAHRTAREAAEKKLKAAEAAIDFLKAAVAITTTARDQTLKDMIAGAIVVLRSDEPFLGKLAEALAGGSAGKAAAEILSKAEAFGWEHLQREIRRAVVEHVRPRLQELDMDKFLRNHIDQAAREAIQLMRTMGYPLDARLQECMTRVLGLGPKPPAAGEVAGEEPKPS